MKYETHLVQWQHIIVTEKSISSSQSPIVVCLRPCLPLWIQFGLQDFSPAAEQRMHSLECDDLETCHFFRERWGPKGGVSLGHWASPRGQQGEVQGE